MKRSEIMKDLQSLRSERMDIISELEEMAKRSLSAEEAKAFDQKKTRAEELERISRSAIVADLQRPAAHLPTGETESDDQTREAFESFGAFLRAIRFDPNDVRLREMSMGDATSGGVLVPDEFRPQILQVDPMATIVRPRATVIAAGSAPDAKVTLPAVDYGTNMFGGAEVNWIGEGGSKPETDIDLVEVSLDPKEVAAFVTVTDKLLRNAPAAGPFVAQMLRTAISASEDYAFLRGTGTGQPKGLLSAACAVSVARATSAQVGFADVAAMFSRLLPESMGRAVWIANPTVLPELIDMADGNGHRIWINGDASKGVPGTLLGIPTLFSGRTPTLGTKGDLILADLSYYLIKDGYGPAIEASPHVKFTNNKTVIKAFWNVDGDGWLRSAVTLEDGSTTVSPFVVLQ
jgi:HK97 family phage major capsid protein